MDKISINNTNGNSPRYRAIWTFKGHELGEPAARPRRQLIVGKMMLGTIILGTMKLGTIVACLCSIVLFGASEAMADAVRLRTSAALPVEATVVRLADIAELEGAEALRFADLEIVAVEDATAVIESAPFGIPDLGGLAHGIVGGLPQIFFMQAERLADLLGLAGGIVDGGAHVLRLFAQ